MDGNKCLVTCCVVDYTFGFQRPWEPGEESSICAVWCLRISQVSLFKGLFSWSLVEWPRGLFVLTCCKWSVSQSPLDIILKRWEPAGSSRPSSVLLRCLWDSVFASQVALQVGYLRRRKKKKSSGLCCCLFLSWSLIIVVACCLD